VKIYVDIDETICRYKKYIDALNQVNGILSDDQMAVHIPNKIKNELEKYKNYSIIALGMDTTFLIEKYQEVEENA
jgi:hypothetical protein